MLGQKVKTLADNSDFRSGKYSLRWDSSNDNGELVSAGVYIMHMVAKGFNESRKMILLK